MAPPTISNLARPGGWCAMNLYAKFRELIASILRWIAAQGRLPADLDLQRLAVEPPRNSAHGGLSTNAAMDEG